ncbi:tRNA (adenosine(37)-N6)-dimethylallyltransferase MiaA [Pedobacter chitinilyticus]|uniref:tRNA dimethylallyltransferase n=1 Tax=Pedobacter chitinilyticus TaxID=2233776 RepID=A0A3S3SSD8_9SPHI|nr:tRNA (adenosine(37)-N6)-dimethylallyltransferase MiaA [Pedobacter chitinilyticus]RWU08284.1 tRNA (adenosine(37)-N6)-dimethylallyltransferase MiaA [Pedobacter chitinilyticus]
MAQKTLIVIVGPTAIGKTSLAIELAKHFQTEIISADSRQFFKEMSIGTAKPSAEELAAAPHHFINSHSINQLFSTGDFEVQALALMEKLFAKHDVLVMVGGSGLYINAVCNGLDDMPEIDLDIREKLNQQFVDEGIESIRKQLAVLDPEYFAKVDQSNPQRMIRGLEVVLSTGQKLSSFLTSNKKERPFNIIKIGLNTEREKLYNQINHRVDLMMQEGLLEEVKSLEAYKELNALKTVGYSEIFDYLEEKIDLTTAIDKIKQNTRRFAKRQLTWFKKDTQITWFEPRQNKEVLDFVNRSL